MSGNDTQQHENPPTPASPSGEGATGGLPASAANIGGLPLSATNTGGQAASGTRGESPPLDRDAYLHDRDAPWPPALPEPIFPAGDRDLNPPGIGFWALLREDRQTHEGDWFSQGYWALVVNRFGNWRMGRPRAVRWMLRWPYLWLRKIVQWTCGIKLDYTVRVGRRVHLWHFGGMILGAQSIGDDVHIRQNTTLGVRQAGAVGKPIIQDRVEIGCGVVILGNIVIGHDAKIGANSVVTTHIPPYSIAVGAPAKVIKTLVPKADDEYSSETEK